MMKYFLCLLTTLIIGTMPSLAFADYEKGTAAFEQSDYETALREFKILAKQKDPRGQYGLGLLYDLGAGVPEDYKEAFKWYRLAAQQGHADAQNNLATLYEEGEGVERDSREAIKWYELAAQQGNFDAPNNLGTMYLKGIGAVRNYVTAYMWFHLGEMKGDKGAKSNRKFVEARMNPAEIAEANKRVSEWMQKYVK
jgi:hypothetical protein|tara:strand:+ start:2463 stop:3050 length:588 start_codon:yes stop_codon:yes gene_type:complete